MLGRLWSELVHRMRAVLRRDAVERELDAELRFHLRLNGYLGYGAVSK